MHDNGEKLMKLFGTNNRLQKQLDKFMQVKDLISMKTVLVVTLDLMGYMLRCLIFLIIIPMLLPAIILHLLVKPLCYVLTVLESSKLLQSGREKETNLKKYILKNSHTL